MQLPSVPPADLIWDEVGHPISKNHNDVYYSRESGLEETQYVFLDNNNVEDRLRNLSGKSNFTIAEIGFGTGLNFLCCWLAWQKIRNSSEVRSLHFVSVENAPIQASDLARAFDNWPQLSHISKQLLEQYPLAVQGCHRLVFEQGRVTLTLYIGDAEEQFKDALFLADAWFLDGFAPHKSPEMWSADLFNIISQHSAQGATFSTFSIAGVIRRGMSGAGFKVIKVPGFGRKKEMQTGHLMAPESSAADNNPETPPSSSHSSVNTNKLNNLLDAAWLSGSLGNARSTVSSDYTTSVDYDVIVIGAGLAGASTATALAARGLKVLVVEKQKESGLGGSGNPQGAVYNKFSSDFNVQTQYALSNLLFSQRYYSRAQQQSETAFWNSCGLIQVAWNDKEETKQAEFLAKNHYPESLLTPLTPKQASSVAGVKLSHGGIHFPDSGWVAPKKLCETLLDNKDITTLYNTQITELVQNTDTQQWSVINGHQVIAEANNIVVCSASDARTFQQLRHLRTKPIRGQVSVISSEAEYPLKTVLCGEGYISPSLNNEFCFGATFDLKNDHSEELAEDHTKNINQLTEWLHSAKELLSDNKISSLKGRASLRCTSPDYVPIIGKAPILQQQIERFSKLRNDAKAKFDVNGAYYEGLFVNIAHGSKGLSSCPLAAEFIASQICNEPTPFSADIVKAISPSRFIIRDLIRRKL